MMVNAESHAKENMADWPPVCDAFLRIAAEQFADRKPAAAEQLDRLVQDRLHHLWCEEHAASYFDLPRNVLGGEAGNAFLKTDTFQCLSWNQSLAQVGGVSWQGGVGTASQHQGYMECFRY